MKIKEELAHRMSKLKPSGIRKIFEIASKREDIINLSIGEPDFDVPAELKNEAIKAIQEALTSIRRPGESANCGIKWLKI